MHRLESHIHLSPGRLYGWLENFLSQTAYWNAQKAYSVEKRPIFILHAGNKPQKIVFWSQMHGNESTGTYALTDLLLHLERDSSLMHSLMDRFSIVVIPMLNPDGAERFNRLNALGSDLNREGLRTLSPEVEILKEHLRGEILFAFNLHDQRTLFSAGSTSIPATLSLLAPSAKTHQGESARLSALKIISKAVERLDPTYRKYVSRFNDEYYPLAMGEWCTDRGIATILVECGGYYNDLHRTRSREMCLQFLKYALLSLPEIDDAMTTAYFSLPENGRNLHDVLLRNVRLLTPSGVKTVDLGFVAQYISSDKKWGWLLEEIGDLQLKYGYTDLDLSDDEPIDYSIIKPSHLYTITDLPKTWHQWFTTT